jgi:hypothetical protein
MRDAHRDFRRHIYGLTGQQHQALLAMSNTDALCGRSVAADEPSLVVDHDHETGRIRGLLCGPCNAGIGHLGDNPTVLISAIAYLARAAPLVDGQELFVKPRPCKGCGVQTKSLRQVGSKRVHYCGDCWKGRTPPSIAEV